MIRRFLSRIPCRLLDWHTPEYDRCRPASCARCGRASK